jgi:ribonuclease-3 family protein
MADENFTSLQSAQLYNGLTLAYIGDAVFEMYVRMHILKRGLTQPHRMHQMAKAYVSAQAQAEILRVWMDSGELDEDELEIVKRGRNAKGRSAPKNTDPATYRLSTAFESLIGFLYLANRLKRMEELIGKAYSIVEGNGTME